MAQACTDRRSLRTRHALVQALADEILATGDLTRVTVTAVAERAGVTRRTFYSHFHDIPDLVAHAEDDLLEELLALVRNIARVHLVELHACLDERKPCPGLVELLEHYARHWRLYCALLGNGGDPALAARIKESVFDAVIGRASEGIDDLAAGPFVRYYVTYVISAEVGVIRVWLEGGMRETPQEMARLMTLLAFVRPGDLYGYPLDINVPAYGLALMCQKEENDD